MMTARERILRTLTYRSVDKIPLSPGHPRQPTLARWREEGLPQDIPYMEYVCGVLGIPYEPPTPPPEHHIDQRMIPTFEEKVLRHENGHYIVQDWMGAITEISDRFDYTYIRNAVDFVTRKWHKFPVETREDWLEMKKRYDPDDPARLPPDMAGLPQRLEGRRVISRFFINGPFWQLREWMGMENLCVAFIERPDFVREMLDFWCNFGLRLMEKINFPIDAFLLSEDMAYKAHPMISPAMTREFLLPVYQKWVPMARKKGAVLIDMDSDGYIADLIPIWIEAGINVAYPSEVAAHNDINEFRKTYGRSMAYKGGIDKRAIAAGGAVMEREVRRVVEPFLDEGGLLPGCDHAVPHDISLQNYIDYTKLLAKLCGWLP